MKITLKKVNQGSQKSDTNNGIDVNRVEIKKRERTVELIECMDKITTNAKKSDTKKQKQNSMTNLKNNDGDETTSDDIEIIEEIIFEPHFNKSEETENDKMESKNQMNVDKMNDDNASVDSMGTNDDYHQHSSVIKKESKSSKKRQGFILHFAIHSFFFLIFFFEKLFLFFEIFFLFEFLFV